MKKKITVVLTMAALLVSGVAMLGQVIDPPFIMVIQTLIK